MKKAENEKSTVLPGYRERMPEAGSILIRGNRESAFGSRRCEGPFTGREFRTYQALTV